MAPQIVKAAPIQQFRNFVGRPAFGYLRAIDSVVPQGFKCNRAGGENRLLALR